MPVQAIRAGATIVRSTPEHEAAQDASNSVLETLVPPLDPTHPNVTQAAEDSTPTEPPPVTPAPARIDAHCERLKTAAARASGELFRCRKLAAQQYAREMCSHLETTPPEPAFMRADLRLDVLPTATPADPRTVPIYVEATNDFVSVSIISSGTLRRILPCYQAAHAVRP